MLRAPGEKRIDVQTSIPCTERETTVRRRPGQVRDAIVEVLEGRQRGASINEITSEVIGLIGDVPASSVRSYLRLNTPEIFARMDRAQYALAGLDAPTLPVRSAPAAAVEYRCGRAALYLEDCLAWLERQSPNSVHAVVTDPPYGLVEYSDMEQTKLRAGRGGVWRIPPSFDGAKRAPLPRFTVLRPTDLDALEQFFLSWGRSLIRVLVPGANVVVASNPLLSYLVSGALSRAGLERRGELVRLVMTMRGGDRPKAAHIEFSSVSVMPPACRVEGRVPRSLRSLRRKSSTPTRPMYASVNRIAPRSTAGSVSASTV